MVNERIAIEKYCLGYTHEKCGTCQNEKNWQILNQLPDSLRKTFQATAVRVDDTKCRLTNMGEYKSNIRES
jgi:hypothetical protein